jgi:S1-C subfamily serine protease
MKLLPILFAGLIFMSLSCHAEVDPLGFDADVSVSGFFNPEIKRIDILKVFENSAAEKAGLKKGDKVIELDGCAIPGCDADTAKISFEKTTGDTLNLLVEHSDGSKNLISITLQ